MTHNSESITFIYKNVTAVGEFTFTKTIADEECVETIDVAAAFGEFLTATGYGVFDVQPDGDTGVFLDDYSEEIEGTSTSDDEPTFEDTYVSDEKPEDIQAGFTENTYPFHVGDTVEVVSDKHTDSGRVLGFTGSVHNLNPGCPHGQGVLVKFGKECPEVSWWLSPTVLLHVPSKTN
jgi:hypothetical protein